MDHPKAIDPQADQSSTGAPTSDQQRWDKIQAVFSQAVELPAEKRRAFVAEMCQQDGELLDRILEMLDEDARADLLLDASLGETSLALLDIGLDLGQLPSRVEREIGPYRLIRLLGEGGMGVVYLAERTDIGGKVAIKLLRDAWLSPMRRHRFRMEQQTLAQLNHPSIARIYDSNMLEDGTPWFVMELAEGLPLTEQWSRNAGTIRDALRLIRRVAEAVQYAHSLAIIHRDLKPSNILLSDSGAVKLLDFGIAKQLNSEEDRTVTGLRMMTLAYAAPEQLSGGAVGVYTDVYALGVLLYELITGQLPRRSREIASPAAGEGEAEKASALLRRTHQAIRTQLSKAEWADLDALLFKALEADPERRYRSADALIRDLDALLDGRPLEAQPHTWGYTLAKFARRNRRTLTAAGVMLGIVAGTVIFFTARLERAREAALREAARTLRIQQFTQSLFDGGDSSAGPAQDLKAVQLLDRGRQQAASLAGDPEMQAEMQATLGGIYQKLGKLDQAEPLLVSSLEIRQKILGADNPKVAGSLVALGLLRKDQGKLDDAESLVRRGVEIQQRLSPVSPALAESMVALGTVLEVRARYDNAREVLESALKLQPQGPKATEKTAENLTELANVYFYQGLYDRSEKLNLQALDLDQRLLGGQNPAVAQEYNNLGAIEMNRGNYPASEAWYRKALAVTEAWYGADHPETAANLTALAQPLTFEKREAEAQTDLERALSIQQRVNGPVNATVATTLNQLGILAFQRKQYDAARGYFTQAMTTWKQLFGEQYPSIGVAASNLGSVCLEEKNLPCAEKMYREAVARLDRSSPNSLNQAVAHIKLGRALLREGRFKDAEPESRFGYQYLTKQVNPSNRFLNIARQDLAAICDGLEKPAEAAKFRAELASATQTRQ